MKTLVVYFSQSGNNRWLADRIGAALAGEVVPLQPKMAAFPLVVLATLTGIGGGIKALAQQVDDYDTVVLVGPLYMGKMAAPLRTFLRRYGARITKLYFVTCCGGGEEEKDGKFGYNRVFQAVKKMLQDRCAGCEAMSVKLIVPADKQNDADTVMKTKLTDETVTDALTGRVESFVNMVKRRAG